MSDWLSCSVLLTTNSALLWITSHKILHHTISFEVALDRSTHAGFGKHLEHKAKSSKEHTSEPVCCSKWLHRTTGSQNATFASLQTNVLKGVTMTKAMSFSVWSSLITAKFVTYASQEFCMRRKKEERWQNPTFSVVCLSTPVYSKVHSQVFCELLGSIILSAYLVSGL